MSYIRFNSELIYFQRRKSEDYVWYGGGRYDPLGDGMRDCEDLQDTPTLLTVVHEIMLRHTKDPKWSYKILRVLAEKCGVLDKMT